MVDPGKLEDEANREIATLRALLRSLTDTEPLGTEQSSSQYCCYCFGQEGYDVGSAYVHEDTCPWLRARALVKEW